MCCSKTRASRVPLIKKRPKLAVQCHRRPCHETDDVFGVYYLAGLSVRTRCTYFPPGDHLAYRLPGNTTPYGRYLHGHVAYRTSFPYVHGAWPLYGNIVSKRRNAGRLRTNRVRRTMSVRNFKSAKNSTEVPDKRWFIRLYINLHTFAP